MPIDPKKIEEWKELLRVGGLPYGSTSGKGGYVVPGDIWNETEFIPAACEALPLLLSEREEMLALLREIEWGGITIPVPDATGVEYECPMCPICGRAPIQGHTLDCRLAALLKR